MVVKISNIPSLSSKYDETQSDSLSLSSDSSPGCLKEYENWASDESNAFPDIFSLWSLYSTTAGCALLLCMRNVGSLSCYKVLGLQNSSPFATKQNHNYSTVCKQKNRKKQLILKQVRLFEGASIRLCL